MRSDSVQGWKLDELAERAGVSPRTVRYYVQRKLLPPPVFRGRDTVYSEEHLIRLLAIRRLQERFLPLDAIQIELARRSLKELQRLAEGRESDGVGVTKNTMSRRQDLSVASPPVERWERWVLAPGLELHVALDADSDTRALAEALRAEARQRRRNGGTQR